MPHKGFADPITSDGIEFRSNTPVNELIDRVARAIKANDVNSTPLVAETVDGATATKMSRPLIESPPCAGAQGRLDLQGDQMHGRIMIAKILGRGYEQVQETLSPKFRYPLLDF